MQNIIQLSRRKKENGNYDMLRFYKLLYTKNDHLEPATMTGYDFYWMFGYTLLLVLNIVQTMLSLKFLILKNTRITVFFSILLTFVVPLKGNNHLRTS